MEKLTSHYKQYLHWQIILPMLGMFLIFGVLGIYLIYFYLQEELLDRLSARGKLAAHSTQFAVESSSTIGGMQRFVASIAAEDDFDSVIVAIGEPAYIVASSKLKHIGKPLTALHLKSFRSDLLQVIRSRQPQYHFDRHGDNVVDYSAPILITNITANGKPLGKGALMLHLNTSKLKYAMTNKLIIMSSLFIAVLFFLGILLLALLRHHILFPQKQLFSTIRKRQRGSKSLVEIDGENEISQLGIAFNDMLGEIDKVEQMKNDFVSTVSHELRTPLTSIRGSIGLILGSYDKHIPDETMDLLKIANRNTDRLIVLINDLLDLEKIVSGELAFDFKIVDLVNIARKSLDANATYALAYQVCIILMEYPENAKIWGDENRLLQVFSNMLSNAIKFSNKAGEVEVYIHEVDNQYRVSVKDYGRGIPDEFRSRVFQRFAQADSSDTKDRGGTGLGLNICKMIIENHNGWIDYTSTVGMGTEFFFNIPKYD